MAPAAATLSHPQAQYAITKALPTPQDPTAFDASQFKLQADGTFRISIRGMAAMAGVDHRGLTRALNSAGDENALPVARSLLEQGFCPGDVSTWSETGGIPEKAAPFILEYYAFKATSPSAQARAVLLAFSRVGINAYLKDKLGIASAPAPSQPVARSNGALPPDQALDVIQRSVGLLEHLGVLDDRDRITFGDLVRNVSQRATGGHLLSPSDRGSEELTISDAWLEVMGEALPANQRTIIGKIVAKMFRNEFDCEPPSRNQYVDGAIRKVKSYRRDWLIKAVKSVQSKNRINLLRIPLRPELN